MDLLTGPERRVVISLPGSNRIDSFMAQPMAKGFEVFEAIDGRLQESQYNFSMKRYMNYYQHPPTPGQVGCAISHFRVIRSFAVTEGPPSSTLLVAEDDSRFGMDFPGVLGKINKNGPFDIGVLADRKPTNPRAAFQRMLMAESQLSLFSKFIATPSRIYRFGRFEGDPYCAALYVITRHGARKFIAETELRGGLPWTVADDWALFRDQYGMDIKVLRPGLVSYEGDSSTRSDDSMAQDHLINGSYAGIIGRAKTAVAVRSRLAAARLATRATIRDYSTKAQTLV